MKESALAPARFLDRRENLSLGKWQWVTGWSLMGFWSLKTELLGIDCSCLGCAGSSQRCVSDSLQYINTDLVLRPAAPRLSELGPGRPVLQHRWKVPCSC